MQKTDLNIASQILFEDNHLLVINKKWDNWFKVIKLAMNLYWIPSKILSKLETISLEMFFLVWFIEDRPTSGLVIYAKTSKALSRLTQMVKNREIKKTYWAVVAKEMIPQSQRLVHYLKK
jgi:23S rRNA pseudouridine1911/1915/1917 synthase